MNLVNIQSFDYVYLSVSRRFYTACWFHRTHYINITDRREATGIEYSGDFQPRRSHTDLTNWIITPQIITESSIISLLAKKTVFANVTSASADLYMKMGWTG